MVVDVCKDCLDGPTDIMNVQCNMSTEYSSVFHHGSLVVLGKCGSLGNGLPYAILAFGLLLLMASFVDALKFTVIPKDVAVPEGAQVNFKCIAVGDPSLTVSYSWEWNGRTDVSSMGMLSDDGGNLTVFASHNTTANYTCVASTSLEEIRATASLTIEGKNCGLRSVMSEGHVE